MRGIESRRADEILNDWIARVRGGESRHESELSQEDPDARPRPVRRIHEKRFLSRRRHRWIAEIARHDNRQLEFVVAHVVVLAHLLQIGQQLPRVCEDVRVVLGGILTNRLPAQRLLVTDISFRPEFSQRARDHELRHRIGPDRLHHE